MYLSLVVSIFNSGYLFRKINDKKVKRFAPTFPLGAKEDEIINIWGFWLSSLGNEAVII
jgi:hypothetical protein